MSGFCGEIKFRVKQLLLNGSELIEHCCRGSRGGEMGEPPFFLAPFFFFFSYPLNIDLKHLNNA